MDWRQRWNKNRERKFPILLPCYEWVINATDHNSKWYSAESYLNKLIKTCILHQEVSRMPHHFRTLISVIELVSLLFPHAFTFTHWQMPFKTNCFWERSRWSRGSGDYKTALLIWDHFNLIRCYDQVRRWCKGRGSVASVVVAGGERAMWRRGVIAHKDHYPCTDLIPHGGI